jgi:hypothetical protein
MVRAIAGETYRRLGDAETAANEAALAGAQLELMSNFELHRRKVFWVDEALAWMLGATRLDIRSEALELPFASFALVFTDRYALGLAERLCARDPSARLRGRMLSVVTVYVTRIPTSDGPSGIRLAFVCDALDGGFPYLVVRELVLQPEARLDEIVSSRFSDVQTETVEPLFRSAPLRRLVELVINAILYATSAEAEPARREPAASPRPRRRAKTPAASDEAYYLPGTIDISQLKALQRARRGGAGELSHRCMVRGHWRGANRNWKHQSPRWIKPYWRGPSAAAVIEREYRLRP